MADLTRLLARHCLRLARHLDRTKMARQRPLINRGVEDFYRQYTLQRTYYDIFTNKLTDVASANSSALGVLYFSGQVRSHVRWVLENGCSWTSGEGGGDVEAIDVGFAALRELQYLVALSGDNRRLLEAADQGASLEEGAIIISDLLNGHGASPSSASSCGAEVKELLDRLADDARYELQRLEEPSHNQEEPISHAWWRPPPPSTALRPRLTVLQAINAALYGSRNALPLGAPPRSDKFCGEYGDIAARSDLVRVLREKRGIPITLAVVYQAVAARLGLSALHLTNFPNHVLLRLNARSEDEGGEGVGAGQGADCEGGGGAQAAGSLLAHGLFVAEYGPHGQEVVEVAVHAGEEGAHAENDGRRSGDAHAVPYGVLTATKITGDNFVPAGEVSFRARVPLPGEGLDCSTRNVLSLLPFDEPLEAEVQVASAGFQCPSFRGCELGAQAGLAGYHEAGQPDDEATPQEDHACLVLRVDEDVMTFRAVKDGDLFFLDAFNNGKIMTEGMIRGYLAETFGIFGRPKKRRGMSDGGNRATSGKECGGAKDETEQRNGESDGECVWFASEEDLKRAEEAQAAAAAIIDPQEVWMRAVRPEAIWSRMTRNLALFYQKQAPSTLGGSSGGASASPSPRYGGGSASQSQHQKEALRWALISSGLDSDMNSETKAK